MSSPSPPRGLAAYASSSDPILKLPHPYLTAYDVAKATDGSDAFQLRPRSAEANTKPLREPLHNSSLFFTAPQDVKSSDRPHESNNTPWGRARRSPAVAARWKDERQPTVGQLWLLTYTIFTVRPRDEAFRLQLQGSGADRLARQLTTVGLAIPHPASSNSKDTGPVKSDELLVLRGSFWQGAGSPFGARPAWVPETQQDEAVDLANYPAVPAAYTMTSEAGSVQTWHPRRRAKPAPGSVVYSRYIAHLGETFSMAALDYTDPTHLGLFHTWQNDPRVSQGWNETGTVDQHRDYLRRAHDDPHQITLLAAFDGVFFAYFEVYWGKEDRIGAYYSAGDYDRGRHSLVGDVRFRGPHRVSAWWSSLMHYLFLDEARTSAVVGEPKSTNGSVLMYDLMHGFGVDKFIDLPHKRSALVSCDRERFFQLCPLDESDKAMGGTGVGLLPKL
ncbi:acyl-CoA N-acyltransferase [Lasiosphaeria ovina]|uniref:Acyl-CoA N-acyltransferase n=1 Tax=Lasiosphaeria ovina TaxID=92902 RepID=A0AAE0MYU6_9PEZI|nr:acyl-CoA N-acyltransferase [Lasiosphaeria ovina]